MQFKKESLVLRLTTAALLLGTAIVLTRFLSLLLAGGLIRLELGQIALQLSGILLGPLWGAFVGATSDLIGTMLISVPFHWGFTLDYLLIGLIFGLARYFFKHRISNFFYLLLPQIAVTLGVNLLLRSLWLAQLQNIPYLSVVVVRLAPVLISGGVYFFFTFSIVTIAKKVKLKLLN